MATHTHTFCCICMKEVDENHMHITDRSTGEMLDFTEYLADLAICTPARNPITDDAILVENWPVREEVEAA